MEDQVNLCVPPNSSRVQGTSSRRWPTLFWVTLKILSVFHHEDLVNERKCYTCRLKDLSERERVIEDAVEHELGLNCLLLMYESVSKRRKGDGEGSNNRQQPCEVCDTMWWNFQGKTEKYTAKQIGATSWNHKGSGALSCCVLFLTIAALLFEMSYHVSAFWAKPEKTPRLLNRFTLFILLVTPSLICVCSKLRSMLRSAVPCLSWASTFNARFIIRRGQILDLPRKGLPGKVFLVACMMWPLFNSVYRSYIYLHLIGCGFGLHVVATAVVAILFMQTWGFFVYILYFIRMSFQRNMNLLLSFIKEHEGQLDKCKGILACVAIDFSCYSQLCELYALVMIPVGVLALTTNITWEFMLGATCISEDLQSAKILYYVKLMSWSEIAMAFFLTVSALGGLQVTYIWDDLSVNILHLTSERHYHFWKGLSIAVSSLTRESNSVLTAVVFSLIGIYTGFHFGSDQNVSYLSESCISQNYTFLCT
ncbi:hypothetical protein HOLleu_29477 [Holothuria leucospilota]|uniref:Uncharacterized protein n=1 Tax=Holothuria leucospilota TaxID=206669 RepID=A0A9Q1H2N4_HOLLE|nr:hypothetical protein HOLleu_29477 [Holothuria leucospilota]